MANKEPVSYLILYVYPSISLVLNLIIMAIAIHNLVRYAGKI